MGETQEIFKKNPVAYFCTEYALNAKMPMAGGLGVLAADTVKEAYDQNFPMVAIGLFYRKGYITIKDLGQKTEIKPEELGLKPLQDENGQKISVVVPTYKGDVTVKAWVYENKTIPIYFLDTNVEENEVWASTICDHLYVGDRDLRIAQEMVLGIGGTRLLKALGIKPSVYHMNDSYSAFLVFELMKDVINEQKVPQERAYELARKKIVYTNHTLVAAGNDAFPEKEVAKHLEKYAGESDFLVKDLLVHGHVSGEKTFSMTMLALRCASKINCVSRFHADEARRIWPEFEIDSITNGIHLPTWDKVVDGDLVETHKKNKRELLEIVNGETGPPRLASGEAGDKWGEEELLITWAKRIVSYKQPLALFGNIKRLIEIVKDTKRPVRIIIAGMPHYEDKQGIEMTEKIKKYAENELREHLVYIDNYSVSVADRLISGSDVWLNTPKIGWEACGTSTMKAALNGCLNCSTRDGWLHEVGLSKIGWEIHESNITRDILDLLEDHIIPCYYGTSDQDGLKFENWESKMRAGRNLVLEDFSTTRMLKEYIEKLYLPLI